MAVCESLYKPFTKQNVRECAYSIIRLTRYTNC